MPFADIWGACHRNDWLTWLTRVFGLPEGDTPDETRQLVPWSRMAEALANPLKGTPCASCDNRFPPDTLSYGYCESCANDRVHCMKCDALLDHEDNHPCAHLRWSNSVGAFVGTGAYDDAGLAESFDALLVKLGLVLARKLRDVIGTKDFGRRHIRDDFGDCGTRLDDLMDYCRDHDNVAFEHGLFWLDTLYPEQLQNVDRVQRWITAHISRRVKAIAADKQPRRILADGGGRFYVADGTWSAVRADALRMTKRKAHKTRRLIERVSPGVTLRVIHVLVKAPKWEGNEQ
jgi:hypothetical protein